MPKLEDPVLFTNMFWSDDFGAVVRAITATKIFSELPVGLNFAQLKTEFQAFERENSIGEGKAHIYRIAYASTKEFPIKQLAKHILLTKFDIQNTLYACI